MSGCTQRRIFLSGAERWYVVHSLPHRETGATFHLENQGFATFLPRRLQSRRHARKLKNVLVPFFPRYFFVILDLDRDRWRSINGTFGVASLIMEGERPMPVPRGGVEALLEAADDLDVVRFDARGNLRVGDRVQVSAGPLANHIGEFRRLDDQGRVDLLLDIMGRQTPVRILREFVIPA